MFNLKKYIKKFFILCCKLIIGLFYKNKYLSGKYFEENNLGWKWALRGILWQKILGFNRHIPWPVSPFINISDANNIEFDIDDIDNFQKIGNYYQNFNANIIIGKGTYIAQNVAIITANHDLDDLSKHVQGKDVIIGEKCWIGINSTILPGVELGNHTIVGAGSVVTKSFVNGNCIIAGVPAIKIRDLE